MAKSKKTLHQTYAITISPPDGFVTFQTIEQDLLKFIDKKKKTISKYAYCIESGSNGTHPHFHLLINYTTLKRQDTIRRGVKTYFTKLYKIPDTNQYMVHVQPSYQPLGWLTDYMRKEGLIFKNHGFDIEEMIEENKSLRRTANQLSYKRIRLNRYNFPEIYESIIPTFKSKYTPLCNQYIKELMTYLRSQNYAVLGYFLYNKKQIIDVLKYFHDYEIEFFLE